MTVLRRIVAAGFFGALAFAVGLMATFGPAQQILADPELQSAKFIAAFAGDPPPRMNASPFVLPLGVLVAGLAHATAFQLVYRGLPRNWFAAGLVYGLAAWLIGALWFEFYLPWNVMLEPWPLAALELACWLGVSLLTGLAIACVFRKVLRAPPQPLIM
ncbi:hypothetical protein [Amphiplicatus metriothermophilus]|uniref:Transmembrane protein n=1 Tax=Amphiplicatus metriothermophilus TaxID=1519374 RepID=A0A239PSV0_9PROT|nr:hypothetical protein [Amphiplicatus metriothermophilus]MBB5519276.1 hypothetical protein [Amphiplicatus metriothermophilus]SNT73345.1 hypothetical protein SAMN06297382_1743 [Amphiplicatus metriothermophilus]